MASFGDQIRSAGIAHQTASAIEDSTRYQIEQTFTMWEAGELTDQTVRHKLEAIIRLAYRSSAAVAASHASRESYLPGWRPQEEIFTTKYLSALISDIRRNLRDYKASDKSQTARRRAISRMQHSAGVAAQRGYTDALIASYKELQDLGFQIRKIWIANFRDNVPCDSCRALHGTEVGLEEEFPTPTKTSTKIYHNLLGPPRHPRCRCHLVILIVSLENAFEKLDIEKPQPAPSTMTTDDVKKMPGKIFTSVVKALQKIISRVRGKR